MYNAFQTTPSLTPFSARPARVDIAEKNAMNAWGAEASAKMYLAEADLAPELELNEILWKSVRGAASPMPPPVRAAFVRGIPGDDDDEKDDDDDRPAAAGRR
jgi:hypothetical protein